VIYIYADSSLLLPIADRYEETRPRRKNHCRLRQRAAAPCRVDARH
jgi:hypothetical protein